jgi:hypothetical protein
MSKKSEKKDTVKELRAEYDFSEGQRGKYAARFKEVATVVLLEPDVAALFSDFRCRQRGAPEGRWA